MSMNLETMDAVLINVEVIRMRWDWCSVTSTLSYFHCYTIFGFFFGYPFYFGDDLAVS